MSRNRCRSYRPGLVRRLLPVLVVAAVLGTVGYAATGPAGSGTSQISGYAISDVRYGYSADMSSVSSVSFTLDKRAKTVQVALVAAPGTNDWQACGPSSATAPFEVACIFATPVPSSLVTTLSVAATG